jgi:signal peptidase II
MLVGCDQVTKSLARNGLSEGEPVVLMHGFVRLTYAENPGVFMGIGADLDSYVRWAIYGSSLLVVVISTVLLLANVDRLSRTRIIGLLLLLSGALGNLVDRFANHASVIDFIVLRIGTLHTGVFNLADVLITMGVVVFLAGEGLQGRSAM